MPMFFKKMLMHINSKWYPRSVLVGKPVTTAQVAKRLAAESTLSPADVYAVLIALGGVLGEFMAQGRSVRLEGIGTFYFTSKTKGGVATAKEVNAKQIVGVRVRFTPETHYNSGNGSTRGKKAARNLTDVEISWEEWKGDDKKKKKNGTPTP